MPEIDITGTSNTPTASSPLNSPGDYSRGPLSRNDLAAMQVQARQTKLNFQQRRNAQKEDQKALADLAKAAALNFRQRRDAQRQDQAALRDSAKAAVLNYRQRINNQKEVKRLQDQEFNKAYKLGAWEVANEKVIQSKKDQEFNKAYKLGAWEVANEKVIQSKKDQEFNKAYALGRWEQSNERYIEQKKESAARKKEIADAKKYREDYALAQYLNRDMDIRNRNKGGGGGWASTISSAGSRVGSHFGNGVINAGNSILRDTLSGIPVVGGVILGALDAAKDLATLPQELAALATNLVSGAAPNWNLRLAAAQGGRAGGYSGDALVNRLINPNPANQAWMQRMGVDPADIPGVLSAYGQGRLTSASQAMTAAKDFYGLSFSQSIGGMDPSAYAQLSGQGETLFGGSGRNMIQGAGQSMDSGFFGQYWRKYQQVTEYATARGVDQSTALNTMSSLMQNAASGSANVNQSGLADFYARLLGSGDANMRSGQGVLQMQSGLQGAIDSAGIGGNTTASQAIMYGINKAGGLKAIGKNINTLANFVGVDTKNMTNGQKQILENALPAAQAGNGYEFISLIRPLISSQQMLGFATGYASSYNLGDMTPLAAANIANVPYQGYVDSQTPYAGLPASIGFGAGGASDKIQAATMAAAYKTGLSSSMLMGVFGAESSYGKNLYNASSGAAGLGQVIPSTFKWLQATHEIDSGLSYNDLLTDPNKSALISAEVLGHYMRVAKGNETTALYQYGGWQDSKGNWNYNPRKSKYASLADYQKAANSYVGKIEGVQNSIDQNSQDDINGPRYVAGQLVQVGAKNAGKLASAVLNPKHGSELINDSNSAQATFSTATDTFSKAVDTFKDVITRMAGGVASLNATPAVPKNHFRGVGAGGLPLLPGETYSGPHSRRSP